MNAFLIALQGISGGAHAIATQGFSSIDDVVTTPLDPGGIGGGGGGGGMPAWRRDMLRRYYSEQRQSYEVPLAQRIEMEDEEIIIAILLEVARYEF